MYPPVVIQALNEALRNIYWYKNDLRRFLLVCDLPNDIVSRQAWHDSQEYKVRIIGKILDELVTMGDSGLGAIRRLIQNILEIPNFDHLRDLEDAPIRITAARQSVEKLRELVLEHDETIKIRKRDQTSRSNNLIESIQKKNDAIDKLKNHFLELVGIDDAQKRGFQFERFLYDLFVAYDLNPRGSFRIVGEQIDGAFEFDGTQFLLEAKWHKNQLGSEPLDVFSRKVERRLENTLGLFIALNGFTEDGLRAFGGSRPSIILMDGQDLAYILQDLIDFRDLLKRKIRHASQTGEPFLRAGE